MKICESRRNAWHAAEAGGGSIAGKITARDGGLAGLQSGLNNLASQLITRFNSIYSSGCGLNGGAGGFFYRDRRVGHWCQQHCGQ